MCCTRGESAQPSEPDAAEEEPDAFSACAWATSSSLSRAAKER